MDSVFRRSRRSLSSGDNITPRTLIQGFLQTAQTVRQSPRKKGSRVTPGTRTPGVVAPSPSSQRRRTRTPGTLPRTVSSLRRSTRIETIATPGGSNPTPRGLITGFLQAANIQTPAVHLAARKSSPLKRPTPLNRNIIQARAESTNSSSIESPAEEAFSRFARPQPRGETRPRRHQAIDRDEFAARVRERLGQEERDETDETREEETLEEQVEERRGDRDTTTNGTLLESIVEDPLELSLQRPDSTTRDTSGTQAPGSARSSRRPSSRRSLIQDSSFQVPSTSTGADVSAQSMGERRASHPSASSLEEDTVMARASQDTVEAHSSADDADAEGDDQESGEVSGEDMREEEEEVERMDGGEVNQPEVTEPQEMEVDMEDDDDGAEDDFDDADVVAPTQPAVMESLRKTRLRPGASSPLKTPHLRAAERRSTPTARTPAPFRQAQQKRGRQLPQQRGVQKKAPGRSSSRAKEPPSTLPRSLTKGIFSHFSKVRVPRDVLGLVEDASGKFFKHVSHDLQAYCKHAGRTTIEQADVELLMKRQRVVSDKEPLQSLIEKYLPMEYREELIPMARSGNKVYPRIPKK